MSNPSSAETFIRFQLEQLAARNEHHKFEQICTRIARRRISSNILLSIGPASAGGDQGRDTETYYTRLPEELPGAAGFVGRATSRPVAVACTVQRTGLPAKIRGDLASICRPNSSSVENVAFFSVHEISAAKKHELQQHARAEHQVNLEIFVGEDIATFLAEPDLVWVAQKDLDLPAAMVPEQHDETAPRWYNDILSGLRHRNAPLLSFGDLSQVRQGLRHATFDAAAKPDLPEWLEYTGQFLPTQDASEDEVTFRARYEISVARLRGMDSLDGVEGHIRAAMDFALDSESPAVIEDAGVLLMYWGGGWVRDLATCSPNELRDYNLRMRKHIDQLLSDTDETTYPIRTQDSLPRARSCVSTRVGQNLAPRQLASPPPARSPNLYPRTRPCRTYRPTQGCLTDPKQWNT
ncbi:hypothetical protein P3H15_28315 [Rhodococcus sp. T2V]|uniref:hypothetical protein n=1 Tax=Rhodococcus sp. T2V TaxID=3034164 RepID=UPI0023E1BA98|nr:hypothetical protein [Rhodococcus sp. T2V]MDF3308923.1 hypothetical protein [Rhodococcus sp. T2V]